MASAHQPEAVFVIDGDQRITEWSSAATTATGISPDVALGAPCYEIVQGRDSFGREVCRRNCREFKALLDGQATSICTMVAHWPGRPNRRFTTTLTALPLPSGGALATLVERGSDVRTVAHDTLSSRGTGPPPIGAVATVDDLAKVTVLSSILSPGPLGRTIDRALDWVWQTMDIEVAELFLVDPKTEDMILTAHRGPFKSAFSEIARFRPGEGFPGLIRTGREPIVTEDVSLDPRFLRARVKAKGFHPFICVPLMGRDGIIGSLNVATRRPDADIHRALRLLTWASHPISTALDGGLLENRLLIRSRENGRPRHEESEFDSTLRGVLRQMMLIGEAPSGVLTAYDWEAMSLLRRVREGDSSVGCVDAKAQDSGACPALAEGHGVTLDGARDRWPVQCQRVQVGRGMVYCLPLEAAGEKVGVVQLGYGEKDPSPQTKYLPFLLNVSEEAAQVVQQAKANQQAQDRAATMLREWKHRLNGNDGNLNAAEERPSLEIRCLGPFELYRDGSLILSEAFPRRRASTLLKVLLVHEGRPVPRDLLAELLWPETDPGVAANRIYGLVHILRRVLEPGRNGGASVHILNDGDRYRFVGGDSFRLDLQEFREYIQLGQRMDRDGETLSAISSYETAVGLYRGDLLEDEPYAEWCWDQRASVQEMLLDASKRLAALHMDQGSPQESINLYRHALGIDPLREEIHQRLMRALWVAGQREEASRQYQVCREILLRELGVAPLPETEELHSLIRGRREP